MPTPADLRAMRNLLGYTREELGGLLGGLSADDVRKIERSRTWFTFQGHVDLLEGLLVRVNREIDASLQGAPPAFLITFPNDGAFRDYAPDWHAWMQFNSAHLLFTARLLDAWMASGHRPEVMELVPTPYEEFRAGKNLPDDDATRLAWAADYRPIIKSRPGMPMPGRRDEN